MWAQCKRGVLKGSEAELARLGNCTTEELQTFLAENERLGFADIKEEDSIYTVTSRRMVRDDIERRRWAKAKEEQRKGQR
jgi:hypothetical protein